MTARRSLLTTWCSASNRIKQPQGTMQIYIAGIGEVKKGRRLHGRLHHAGTEPDSAAGNIIDFRIMSKSWSEKNKVTNIQDWRGKRKKPAAQCNGYRPLHVEGLGARAAYRDGGKTELVGQEGRQRQRLHLSADQGGRYPHLCPDRWRHRHVVGSTAAGRRTPEEGPEAESAEGIKFAPFSLGMDQWSDEAKYTNVRGKTRSRTSVSVKRCRSRWTAKPSRSRSCGLSVPAAIIVAPGVNGHSNDIDKAEFNVEKAKKLLAEAGYPNGFELTLDCPTTASSRRKGLSGGGRDVGEDRPCRS